ncbi:MAG: siderophore-iron reductase FhuF [Halomonas sp.]|nr:siderophore-iron reductase FhuF [Halomonas sp.]MDN6298120.1 siderophore-iron reductase FhuF [Halomonas sp.]MDN6315433.1 siderophore-iron reductase FhuF [Halomonas sp.]MDN6336737.1 siderophore-iron reductase FhuF [Halomonas sp.]
MSHAVALDNRPADPQQALLALYRAPPLDALKAPAFGRPPVPAVRAAALADRDVLAGYLQRFATGFSTPVDDKAVASIWSKFYLATVSIPALVANLLLDVALPAGPAEARLEFSERGQAARLWLVDGGRPLASRAPDTRFSALFDQHCAPLIEALAALSGLSPRVFWSNLGHYVEYVARLCAQHPAFTGAGDALLAYLDMRVLSDGRRNPLYQPVRYLDVGAAQPARVRRVCCVKYRQGGEALCGNCPLKTEHRPPRRAAKGESQ